METDQTKFKLNIPLLNSQNKMVNMRVGEILFLLGANGTGKSGLLYHINKMRPDATYWIKATRQTFFSDNYTMFRPSEIQNVERRIERTDTKPDSRFKDDHAAAKPNIIITRLMHAMQKQNSQIAQIVRKEKEKLDGYLEQNTSPLDTVNRVMSILNLPIITKEVNYDENILVQNNNGDEFALEQLSDGERTVLLITAEVITTPPDTMILIDEPERHLHRSIISPLIKQLLLIKKTCCFIIATHEVTLPLDHPESQTLFVRSCQFDNGIPAMWDIDHLAANDEINEKVKADILGSRRKLLFVEGTTTSLDKLLYSVIFPDVTIIPKQGFSDVIQAVKHIRSSEKLHWLKAYGIIDKDYHTPEQIASLQACGVYSLPVHSIESIYYSRKMLEMVCDHVPHLKQTRPIDIAIDKALDGFSQSAGILGKHIVTQKIRREILQKIPDPINENPINISLQPKQMILEESQLLQKLITELDYDSIIAKYSVKRTNIPSLITGVFGLKQTIYEQSVCQIVRDDSAAKQYVTDMFGALYCKLLSN